ncbi:hypothetical protein CY35_07G060200 [Sphagnum magellanicum]|uniref:Uncharacterized protein n=1 Tax=Sphagnum magellanicum TaxID=128215 RepID=A0ACB8HL97_9BRYO|nr:hypothetical protein CY35_07G060200 [Sphagnum magellanicum]
MTEVVLHVYDVTNSGSGRANATIRRLNKILRDGMGIGGIFHGAIQVYSEEWSFGYCEFGTGVFCCTPTMNPMYTHRESIVLGHILLSRRRIGQILSELSREWNGSSYDPLSRNCNHFCDALCERLGVPRLPLWVNRFANAGEAAVEAAGNTMEKLRQAKAEVVTASRIAKRFIFSSCTTSTSAVTPDPWLKNMATSSRNSRRIGFSRNPSQQLLRNQSCSRMENETEDNRLVKHHRDMNRDTSSKECCKLYTDVDPF